MRRRDFTGLLAGLAFVGVATPTGYGMLHRAEAEEGGGTPFDASLVRRAARDLAAAPYRAPDRSLPPALDQLSYDDYRNIRFRPERAIWRGAGSRYELQLFSRGFLFRDRVEINLVSDGRARPVPYAPEYFRFDNGLAAPAGDVDVGFSGFRLHTPLNTPDVFDELAVFQGASYFRAIARGQVYGTSARGLAIKTGDPAGEEFPLFKAFWIETPRDGAETCVVHALLDSPSVAGAFRFTLRSGETTTMDVEMSLYPRVDLEKVGLAPLTSMFLFGPNDRVGVDDFRPAVRDAEGLAIVNANGEVLWRPLTNPQRLQISEFSDAGLRGFGLLQRQRSFFDYQDLEARYERRPGVWVEPIGDWGPGAVFLVEIPTAEEVHDNIVSFWRPREPLGKGGEYSYTYRLHWGWNRPGKAPELVFGQTRVGGTEARRDFVIDVVGEIAGDVTGLRAEVGAGAGKVGHVALYPNPEIDGWRLAFSLEPDGGSLIELRAQIMRGDKRVSEVWIYRWTP